MVNKVSGNYNVNPEDVCAQVDWSQPQQLQDAPVSGSLRSIRRALGFEDIQITPDSPKQKQVAQKFVAGQVRHWNDRLGQRQTNDHERQELKTDDHPKDQTDRIDEQMLHEGVVANRNLGKRPLIDDPPPDP